MTQRNKEILVVTVLLFTGAGSEKLLKFKKWFWSILEKMPMAHRQELVSYYSDRYRNKLLSS